MKKLILSLLLLLPLLGFAQNYQCLQAGVKHYFINHSGYLRGIRVDSVRTFPDSTLYYPYHTPRGKYGMGPTTLDSNGGSWLGKKVIELKDRTFLFDNLWGDTIVINTAAAVGDKWMFYNDTGKLYYEAELIATDTMTVLGITDSVKKILITAKDPSGIVSSDPANGYQVILSKNNGFVHIFDLYTFPYHEAGLSYMHGLDFYLDNLIDRKTGNREWEFKLVDFVNTNKMNLHQWNVGDVYGFSACNGSLEHYGAQCYPVEHYYLYTVNSVTTAPGKINYDITSAGYDCVAPSGFPTSWPSPGFYTKGTGTGVVSFDTTVLIDTLLMPEEYKQQMMYGYLPGDSSYCTVGTRYSTQRNVQIFNDQYYPIFEIAADPSLYKAPLGLLTSFSAYAGSSGSVVTASDLIYYSKSGSSCGAIANPPTSINNVEITDRIALYPDPVTNELTIVTNDKVVSVAIVDLLGHVVYSHELHGSTLHVSVADFPPGLYIARINGVNRKFIKL